MCVPAVWGYDWDTVIILPLLNFHQKWGLLIIGLSCPKLLIFEFLCMN